MDHCAFGSTGSSVLYTELGQGKVKQLAKANGNLKERQPNNRYVDIFTGITDGCNFHSSFPQVTLQEPSI